MNFAGGRDKSRPYTAKIIRRDRINPVRNTIFFNICEMSTHPNVIGWVQFILHPNLILHESE